MNLSNPDLRKPAQIALIVGVWCIVAPILEIFQTRYQLVSPLIPESTVDAITLPFFYHAVLAAIGTAIALCLFLARRYGWVLVMVAVTLILQSDWMPWRF